MKSQTTCNCKTFTTEEGRHKITQAIAEANKGKITYAAAPYGLTSRLKDPQKLITTEKRFDKTYSKTRLNDSLHAKLLFYRTEESYKVIHGSGNFTENSIQNQHEIYNITCRSCHPQRFNTLFQFFQKIWKRSTNTQQKTVIK